MPKPLQLRIALPLPLRQCFDYCFTPTTTQTLSGCRVQVNFNHRLLIGVIIDAKPITDQNAKPLKPIEQLIDQQAIINTQLLRLCQWASQYYHHSLGQVIASALPKAQRQGKLPDEPELAMTPWQEQLHIHSPEYPLNADQTQALNLLTQHAKQFTPFFIEGITGSGKTEVYLQIIAQVLTQGQQALVLVPEIGLTPQTLERFQARFTAPIVTLHSGMTDKQRAKAWWQIYHNQAAIVIGTRSAVFAPLVNPGIIIIDEEHDTSFKQSEGFRYSARDLAIKRAQLLDIPIVLGTATPSLESYYNIQHGKYQHIVLSQRAGNAVLPQYELLDIRQQALYGGLSPQLLTEVEKQLADNNQILFFLNRRGYAAAIICHSCGYRATCSHCDAYLTLHQSQNCLLCHHCARRSKRLYTCPDCQSPNLLSFGLGTEKLQEVLSQHFPDSDVIRIDSDNIKNQKTLLKQFEKIKHGQRQILIGTQMLAKGHHFPNVTLVAVIDADSGLFSADFRACERLGQLVTQVAGRAGRAEKTGKVMIQTHQPEHPWLRCLVDQPYSEFLRLLSAERQKTHWPPYSYLALIQSSAPNQQTALHFLQQVKQALAHVETTVEIMGPVPALMAKRAGRYRMQLLLRAQHRHVLQQFLHQALALIETVKPDRSLRWHIDVDPLDVV